MNKYTFATGKSSFFLALKERVETYFIENNLHTAGNSKIYLKGIIQVLSSVTLYITLVFVQPSTSISILLCILLGINLAVIGFNVMHEGGHQTFSRHAWLNKLAAYFLNVLGGNAYYWKIKHNVNHHTYTNIEGMDSDIDIKPFMRLHSGQQWHSFHRFQHVYWIFLYAISYIVWVFYEDFQKYFSGRITPNCERKSYSREDHFVFWFTKIMYVVVYMVIPIIFLGWLPWLIGFLVITLYVV